MHTQSEALPDYSAVSARSSHFVKAQFIEAQNRSQPFPDVCIHTLFEAQVEKTPDAVALIFEQKQLTYQQLNHRANQLAHFLRESGVKAETFVGVCLDRSIELIVALLGILKAGGTYVPIDPTLPLDRLAFILEDAQVSRVVTQRQWIDKLPETTAKIVLDAEWNAISDRSPLNPINQTHVEHLMYIIYTSGSTGKPKGVMVPHSGICNQLFWRQTTFELTDRDRVLQSIPFSFDPSVWQIFWALSFGAQLVLARPGGHQDSAYLAETIVEQQISTIALVPTMLRVLLEEKALKQSRHLKHVFCGGEALPSDLIDCFYDRLPTSLLHNVYGPTEASIDATYWTCKPNCASAIAPIGHPITHAEIYILDSDLQPVEVGASGELHIGGAGLARGYLNRPQLTVEKFISHPFRASARLYKTGDLGCFLPDGTIQFLGRIDHQVKIRGFRIELQEIEATLNQHPGVRESIVVAREDRPGDKRLVAYVVSTAARSELRQFLAEKLPAYMVPANFVELASLPLNPNGKVDRHALPEPERDLEQLPIAPRNKVELELVKIWEKVLGVSAIGVDDSFIELGGDSILAAQIVQQIEQVFEKKLPLIAFFQAPTIAQLAQLIQAESIFAPSIVPIQPDGAKPPLFGVHVLGKGLSYYRPLAKHLGRDQPVYGLAIQLSGDGETTNDIKTLASQYVQAIRSLQPKGPYYLAGVSFGGIVAFEMAQQLHAQEQTVALLGLFDTPPPPKMVQFLPLRSQQSAYFKRLSHLKPIEVWTRFKKRFLEWSLKSSAFESGLRWIYGALDRPFPDALQHLLYVHQNEKATSRYSPQVYPGRITMFLAKDQVVSAAVASDPRLCWQELTQNSLEVHEVSGDHMSMLQEPHVQSLAEALKLYLR